MHDNQWEYGNFPPHARSYEHNSYDFYESNRFGDRDFRNGENYANIDERFQKRRDDYEGDYDSYNYGGYHSRKSSQTLETTSRPLSYKNLKLSLLCGNFCPYDYEAWEQKSLSYVVNVWWNSKCEIEGEWELNQSRLGA
ncbi:hypothetical protein M9H77_18880 [Catharanthus roseus]|uniref:Uncharacterized protein n=1 Tax=Catharanthus roseus TaxID=4058 RepID=A0ACC0B8U0_CATRO|nr:hypothetical protein M9H77_18880 [Catharanthus roseus]